MAEARRQKKDRYRLIGPRARLHKSPGQPKRDLHLQTVLSLVGCFHFALTYADATTFTDGFLTVNAGDRVKRCRYYSNSFRFTSG
jgi:hypothetical protein